MPSESFKLKTSPLSGGVIGVRGTWQGVEKSAPFFVCPAESAAPD
ncbi:hypothetical protein REC12_01075 [Desulfosporosinus sp. PR]|nr:hypothetical protein [Desulfosporosinus sp. PR]